MFQPTQILRDEHETILRALGVLQHCCALIDQGVDVDPETLDSLIEFFRGYADRTHHGKEEDLLFPELEARGIAREGGPIGCMLHEHENNRQLTRMMMKAIEELRAGDKKGLKRWAAAAEQYAAGLNDHIYKENNILFVMAERVFRADEEAPLLAKFNQVDQEKIGTGEIQRLANIVDEVSSKLRSVEVAS